MRSVSQRKVLEMVLNNWHRGTPAQHFGSSVRATAWFLWLMVMVALVLGGLAAIVMLFPHVEEHCNDRARTGAQVECAQDMQAQAGGEGDEVGHGDDSVAMRGEGA